jgi:ankyrin repeat protein
MKERPLHVAVGFNASPIIVEGLINVMDREAANRPDSRGHTPLHLCCQCGVGSQILALIVAAWPDAILAESRASRTPLDDLLSYVGDDEEEVEYPWDLVEAFSILLDARPSAIDRVNRLGQTLLHRALMHGTEQVMIQSIPELLLDRKPELAHTVDHRLVTPLHEACKRDDSVHIVQDLVARSSQEQLMARDERGRSVLHYAIHWGVPVDVVKVLLAACHDLVRVEDSDGKTPIDYFVSFYQLDTCWRTTDDVDDEVIQCFFVDSSYRNVTQSGMQPLHSALYTQRCPLSIIGYLARHRPDQVGQVDGTGNLPLHLAAQLELQPEKAHLSNYADVIRSLLQPFPEGARATNPDGILPLHLMIRAGRSWKSGIQLLVHTHPAAICDLNLKSCALSTLLSRLDHDSMYRLLREAPFLVS